MYPKIEIHEIALQVKGLLIQTGNKSGMSKFCHFETLGCCLA